MRRERIQIELMPGPDDPPFNDPRFQEELRELSETLRDKGVDVIQPPRVAGEGSTSGGIVEYALTPIGILAGLVILARPVHKVLGTWFKRNNGRKIRIKFDDMTIEAQTGEDLREALEEVSRFRKSQKEPHKLVSTVRKL